MYCKIHATPNSYSPLKARQLKPKLEPLYRPTYFTLARDAIVASVPYVATIPDLPYPQHTDCLVTRWYPATGCDHHIVPTKLTDTKTLVLTNHQRIRREMLKTQTLGRKRKPSETLSSKLRGRRGSKRKAGVCAGVWFVCGKNT
ncbi:hypothetical protein J6590_052406 [Homalodisca vitripennis]|nr:hypothetical protein J6590_052406 [Homalodisca vitripennis]